MSDRETLDVYDAQASKYEKLTKNEAGNTDLLAFIDALPDGARVLDLGCGPGLFAAKMAASGLTVEAWDASSAMVDLAQAKAGVAAHRKTFDALAGAAGFAGIFANFSLLHAERTAVPDHILHAVDALDAGGIFHIAMKTGRGQDRDSIGRRYCYFSEEELADMLTSAGLRIYRRNRGRDKGLNGEMADWVSLQARKAA